MFLLVNTTSLLITSLSLISSILIIALKIFTEQRNLMLGTLDLTVTSYIIKNIVKKV